MLNETFINEDWKDINGYEGKYQVSNYGRIKSFPKFIERKTGSYFTKEKVLKCTLDNYGYPCVYLYSNGNVRHIKVHILVAKSFIENPNGYSDINHKDGNKTNNRIDNLEWCDRSHNIQHAYDNFLHKSGEEHNLSKLTWNEVNYIRENYKPYDKEFGQKSLAEKFNVDRNTIWYILNNKTWNHKGGDAKCQG